MWSITLRVYFFYGANSFLIALLLFYAVFHSDHAVHKETSSKKKSLVRSLASLSPSALIGRGATGAGLAGVFYLNCFEEVSATHIVQSAHPEVRGDADTDTQSP